ncbi:4Fe-4S binding protein [Sulfobacillus acidophilus]|uniref:Ferredoxin n=1 Tax=Sulfobacillus acidophilus TaxID=53633 RepID=A0ABS3AWM7_9FIRM|nr:4Fe-4S binding protein [Sulfobacillus acidophilus]
MSRFAEFKSILDKRNYFKLVCGAGNKDSDWVETLTFIYAMAGVLGVDMAADKTVVKKAVSGLRRAEKYLYDKHKKKMKIRPFLTVSVGMPGDHHVRKAIINDNCVACDKCIPVCPTFAIPDNLVVIDDLCIGCGACEVACPVDSIEYTSVTEKLNLLLPQLLNLGADNVELHAAVPDDDIILDEWKAACRAVPNNYVSLSIDRNHLSNKALLERINETQKISGERTMIQADGVPMGGTSGELSKTIQAIACAQQINLMIHNDKSRKRKDRNIPILISGGTNDKTKALADSAGVQYHGISIGTYARKQIHEYIRAPDFFENEELIEKAIVSAKQLITSAVDENSNVIDV